jgi:hypothetical protein
VAHTATAFAYVAGVRRNDAGLHFAPELLYAVLLVAQAIIATILVLHPDADQPTRQMLENATRVGRLGHDRAPEKGLLRYIRSFISKVKNDSSVDIGFPLQ